jgi:methyl-accepting chemotaxis protein
MISIFRNYYKISLALGIFFILGIALSLYSIYSIPSSLRLSHGYQSEFFTVYAIIGITFFIGAIALIMALRYKKEVVIFRDRSIEAEKAAKQESELNKSTISLNTLITNLSQAKGEKEILDIGLNTICKQLEAGQGAIYTAVEKNGKRSVELRGGYALAIGESTVINYEFGEGLIGQAAASGQALYVDDVPEGYIKIVSGLGTASPKFLLIVPVKDKQQVFGVMEIASFLAITTDQRKFAEEAAQQIAEKISTNAS